VDDCILRNIAETFVHRNNISLVEIATVVKKFFSGPILRGV
jgi:hypothetical protein